jgi:hypothetical protein
MQFVLYPLCLKSISDTYLVLRNDFWLQIRPLLLTSTRLQLPKNAR